jgi:hypothetical protein
MTVIDYKGYRIEVCPLGKGWRASIFSPGSISPWPNSPVNLEKSSTEEIVAEASALSMCASVRGFYKNLSGPESNPARAYSASQSHGD